MGWADVFSHRDCSLGLGDTLRGLGTASLLCNLTVMDKLSLRGTAFLYENPAHQKPWDPDYTYVASFAVTDALSLSYENYAGNFYPWHRGPSTGGKLADGLVRGSYTLPVNNTLFGAKAGSLPDFQMTAGVGDTFIGDPRAFVTTVVTPFPKVTLSATGNYYLDHSAQKQWDGDFYYTASYQVTERLAVQYNNYAATRWPWDHLPSTGGKVADGSLLLIYTLPL